MQTLKIEVSLKGHRQRNKAKISINIFLGAAIQTKGKKESHSWGLRSHNNGQLKSPHSVLTCGMKNSMVINGMPTVIKAFAEA